MSTPPAPLVIVTEETHGAEAPLAQPAERAGSASAPRAGKHKAKKPKHKAKKPRHKAGGARHSVRRTRSSREARGGRRAGRGQQATRHSLRPGRSCRCAARRRQVIGRRFHLWLLCGCLVLAGCVAAPAAASAAFGFKSIQMSIQQALSTTPETVEVLGPPDFQAGSHPYQVTISEEFNSFVDAEDIPEPEGLVKDLEHRTPARPDRQCQRSAPMPDGGVREQRA